MVSAPALHGIYTGTRRSDSGFQGRPGELGDWQFSSASSLHLQLNETLTNGTKGM